MKQILKYLKEHGVGIGLTLGSILVVLILHFFGTFDILELKTYDFRFTTVRGPLTGWRATDSTFIENGTDVVLVEVDDEAYRLMPEKGGWNEWPYPRVVWAHTIDNLSRAGAKVIAFDIQFDASKEGDDEIARAIIDAKARGTTVIISVKKATESTRIPPTYIAEPTAIIKAANPEVGLINDMMDEDGFSRQYQLWDELRHEPGKAHLTFGVKSVRAFLDIPDSTIPQFDTDLGVFNFGPLKIEAYGATNNFLVNYYGPPSGYKIPSEEYFPPWSTFSRYSLAYIIDTDLVTLNNPEEDIDWMNQFIPGEIPDWIQAIDDPVERTEMMAIMGLGENFDITSSPFYNKIVVIGVAVEVIHDSKSTPYYNYFGLQQLTPGMETHANAIQTLLHNNSINVYGKRLTQIQQDQNKFLTLYKHGQLILLLCIIAYILLSFMNPVLAGILIFIEGLVYFGLACGQFTNDSFWMVKVLLRKVFPDSFVIDHQSWFFSDLPGIGESTMIPIIVPIAGVLVTYTSNVIYKFLVEQRDKKFLKSTFSTYISPDLIDQMYEQKQQPKLGGESGYHTAFFSDIQSFSSFSEVLEPEKMVALMNEYLTEMTDILLNRKGTLDKYIGDAIVAFYGAPVPIEDQEYQACMTALEMEVKLVELREKWKSEEGWPEIVHNMQHRIGLGSGNIVTGNMGSTMRMNYTMMGDTVNISARLEASAKQYGIYIQVLDTTRNAVKERFEWRFLDFVLVKGKSIPVKTYELMSEKEKVTEEISTLLDAFHAAQDQYFAQNWDAAIKGFQESEKLENMFPGRNTNPSVIYIKRCEYLKENPPGDDWDGVWTLTAK
ncbi:MAG: adenylate/guanylate cyclase domain-containing protein [Candidatus Marinimicrobia bacterium]|nr:adenylate/guanylate cyclase domain-containing protein [Candidatus Neomarinimicrobiota bacterium]